MSTSTLTPVFKFDGTNYREWRFRVDIALAAEGLEIVEKPNPVTAEWKKADAKVRKIMVDRMSSEQIELVMGCTEAKTMMDELDNVYSRKNTLKSIQTKRRLLKLVFDEREDASVHLAKFEKIINEIRASGDEIAEGDIIGYFQLTLPTSYDNVISYFDSLPAANKKLANLKARFVDEWSNRNNRSNSEASVQNGTSTTSSEEGKAAFATNRFSGRGNRGNTNFRYSRDNRFYKDNRRNFNNGCIIKITLVAKIAIMVTKVIHVLIIIIIVVILDLEIIMEKIHERESVFRAVERVIWQVHVVFHEIVKFFLPWLWRPKKTIICRITK